MLQDLKKNQNQLETKRIFIVGSLIKATGGSFTHISEVHIMNHQQAMLSKDAAEWQVGVNKEHDGIIENEVWQVIPKASVPRGVKMLLSTWAMKSKANGTKHAIILRDVAKYWDSTSILTISHLL